MLVSLHKCKERTHSRPKASIVLAYSYLVMHWTQDKIKGRTTKVTTVLLSRFDSFLINSHLKASSGWNERVNLCLATTQAEEN